MLHVIQSRARPTEDPVLRAMFVARKLVFIDLLGWDLPVVDGAYEIDQFDTPEACYLVLTDAQGHHLASARLLPTIRPHLLGSHFQALCEGGPRCASDVLEITRFCLDRRLRATDRRLARDTLVSALAEYALANRIAAYTAIAEPDWFRQIMAFGWRARPLGRPQAIDGQMLVALTIEIDTDTPARLRAAGIVPSRALNGDVPVAA